MHLLSTWEMPETQLRLKLENYCCKKNRSQGAFAHWVPPPGVPSHSVLLLIPSCTALSEVQLWPSRGL